MEFTLLLTFRNKTRFNVPNWFLIYYFNDIVGYNIYHYTADGLFSACFVFLKIMFITCSLLFIYFNIYVVDNLNHYSIQINI